jgi:hypothetical protein
VGSNIQEFWVMLEGGSVLYRHTHSDIVDPQLFGGFMSAINSIAATFTKDGLNNFELGNLQFFVLKRDGLIFVANTKKNVKPQKVEKEIQNNINKFVSKYPPELLQTWNGDLTFFDGFKPDL